MGFAKMDQMNEIDIRDLCRTCASGSGTDAVFPLYDGNETTELGTIFEVCTGLTLRQPGYPDRLCNSCQLHLKMVQMFLKKVETSNTMFEEILSTAESVAVEEAPTDGDLGGQSEEEVESILEDSLKLPKEEVVDVDEYSTFTIEEESNIVNDEAECDDAANDDNDSEYSVEYLECEDDLNPEGTKYYEMDNDEIDAEIADIEPSTSITKSSVRSVPKSKRSYPFRCKKCGRRFMYKEVYDAHLRVHKGLPAFSCKHCPKTFNEKANFDYHMQDHTNYRPAKCTMCDKSFKNKQDLASHIRCHKDIRKYMCDVCGKRFRSQSHMVYHRYSHFEERNFHCDLCPQAFKSPHILRTHRNTVHSKVFRFECEECGRKFKRDHHLIAHRGVHVRAKLKSGKKADQESMKCE